MEPRRRAEPSAGDRGAGAAAPGVEVVYATRDEQAIVRVPWEPGLTAGGAVERSGLLARYGEAARGPLLLGVFGAPVAPERLVKPGDRVEICRPLAGDPRARRRELSARGAVMGAKVSPDPGPKGQA